MASGLLAIMAGIVYSHLVQLGEALAPGQVQGPPRVGVTEQKELTLGVDNWLDLGYGTFNGT